MSEDRCICCGAVIPEGSLVCKNFLLTVKEGEDNGEEKCVSG